jgi:glutamate synthase (NADPH/NADH) large chain
VSRIGGIDLDTLAEEVSMRHRFAYLDRPEEAAHRDLWVGGEYQWRREGEHHLFNPETVFRLQHATRARRYDVFKQYTSAVDEQSVRLATLRGLFRFKEGVRKPIPVDEVEPVSEIVKRFSTGAMSYGSISRRRTRRLAVAMNRSAPSPTPARAARTPTATSPTPTRLPPFGDQAGRVRPFRVTSEYLTNADDIQIRWRRARSRARAAAARRKVYPWIARTRHSTPVSA